MRIVGRTEWAEKVRAKGREDLWCESSHQALGHSRSRMTLPGFISSKISSCSPAAKGKDRSRVKVHVHINKRQEEVATHRELVTSLMTMCGRSW